jgi:ATP-dependent DNA helicase RecQ
MTGKSQSPHEYLSRFGLTAFRAGQLEVIQAILDGHDCLCIMPTGGGKSLCYQLPSVMRDGVTVVVSPLIALMKDQVDSLTQVGVAASFINSTLGPADQNQRLEQLAAGVFDLIYVAPERFRSPRFQETVRRIGVQLLAVDEAHCISEWGHDFRHDYTRLGEFRRRIGNPQTIALTATATSDVQADVIRQLGLKGPKTFIAGFARPNLFCSVQTLFGQREKRDALAEFLSRTPGSGIIYAATRKGCEDVAEFISNSTRRRVVVYHGGMLLDERRMVQEQYMSGRAEIVVATNAFGMGIDKPDVRFVVHYNLPGSLEAYYQEAGRAGRDSQPAQCLLMYTPSDRNIQEFFIESNYPSPETIEEIYEFLRTHQDDPIELTQEQLKDELGLSIGAEGVGTCERILEKCGVLERLEPNRNMAAVRIESDLPTLVDLLPKQATSQRAIARAVEQIVGSRRYELVYFRPAELADSLGTTTSALARALRELNKLEAVDYIPPFRGRAVRMIRRDLEFKQLDIDFQELEARRQASFQKLDRVIRFATTTTCRQREILTYFGEQTSTLCGNCDNCHVAVEVPVEMKEAIIKTLSGVARACSRGRFGKQLVAQMLCGSQSAKVIKWKLDELSTFGILGDWSQSEVLVLIECLVGAGLLEVSEVDHFRPVLLLTNLGSDVMRNREAVPSLPLPEPLTQKFVGSSRRSSVEQRADKSRPSAASPDRPAETNSPADRDGSTGWRQINSPAPKDLARPPRNLSDAVGSGAVKPEYFWTWRLLHDGYSPAQCLLIRRIDNETLIDHMLRAIDDGLDVQMNWLLTGEQCASLAQAVNSLNAPSVKTVLERLPSTFSYNQVMFYLKCRDQESTLQA